MKSPDSELAAAVERRRTFAIISHPDAGKTTLTEKLLLYSGAIHLAGAVKARRAQRNVTSDWMELERERGISVTSSVMQFEFDGYHINLLDTPGHEDFSEDTYRTLIAADSAVMVLDNRKGVEERTRQLFEVCKRRRTPIFTFVNKCDRAGEDPLKLLSDVEADLGIACHAVTWPIFRGNVFVGVYDRHAATVHVFNRDASHGSSVADHYAGTLDDADVRELLGRQTIEQLQHDLDLLDTAGHPFDRAAVSDGTQTPVFFGSALTNFGVEAFLHAFLAMAPAPTPRESTIGLIEATRPEFSGFIFKIQANMDARHRDRVAFLRICSGRFDAGMSATLVRTGKAMRLASPQQFLARERTGLDVAWPGDVIGLMDRGVLRIGDTLCTGELLEYPDVPRFAPEFFARAIPTDALRRKQFDAGLRQLTEEGAAQVFYAQAEAGPEPIVGAVGKLQFDVMQFRLEKEYGAPCRFEPIAYRYPRWLTGSEEDVRRVSTASGRMQIFDARGNLVVLFQDAFALRWAVQQETKVMFHPAAP